MSSSLQRFLKVVVGATGLSCLLGIAILLGVLAIASTIPVEIRRPTFESDRKIMAVAMAHQFEYLLGAIAAVILAIRTWRWKS